MDDPDKWECPKCGNLNYGNRVVCNMRSCGAPKDQDKWICPGCGNENYANRLFCNMRRCQQIRPGTTMQQMQQMGQGGGPAGGKGDSGKGFKGYSQPPPAFAYHSLPPQNFDPRAGEPGSWTCECGNLNYAGRTVCNKRSCGRPMPAQQHWGGNPYAAYAYHPPAYAPSAAYVPIAPSSGSKTPPPGSWQCSACQNVNWPMRETCNAKGCGQPRELVDGGPPSSAAPMQKQQPPAPEGSWTCAGCGNVNWPTRTACNKRNCGLPKPNF